MAFSFGSTATTSAPSLFGTTATSVAAPASTGFGFGATQTSAAPFGFGTTAPASTAGFGGGLSFGATQTSTGTTGFGTTGGFGTGLGFGSTQTSAPQFGFGTSTAAPASSAPSFSFGGGTGFGSFGQASSAPSAFGFGTQTTTTTAGTTGLGSFGFGSAAAPFGQAQQQQQQVTAAATQASTNQESLVASFLYCNVYGDERDAILARWNLLQAAWGKGKGYYSGTAPPVDYTPENPLNRFKTVGFSKLPQGKNEDGIVVLLVNKADTDVRRDQAQLVTALGTALGNKPNINIVVEGIAGLDNDRCEVTIYVQERSATGAIHKAPALELASFLWQQPGSRGQLTAVGVVSCVPRVRPTQEQLAEYLATPPVGIDPRIWKQAQQENPDPQMFIPVPLVGFGDLVRHLHRQDKETKCHQATLDSVAEEIATLQRRAAETAASLAEQRRKHSSMQHRLLKVLVKQECTRKAGLTLLPDEERLRVLLEHLNSELNVPTQFRGRLNELLSQVRMRSAAFAQPEKAQERYNVDPNVIADIEHVLKTHQKALSELIAVVKDDLEDLKILEEELKR